MSTVQVTNNKNRPNAKFVRYRAKIELKKQRFYARVDLRRTIWVRVRDGAGNLSRWRIAQRLR